MAQEIVAYVKHQYVEPARHKGEKQIVIRAGDVHDEMKLANRQPLVCDTLRGAELQKQRNIRLIDERPGKNVHTHHARNIWYTFELP